MPMLIGRRPYGITEVRVLVDLIAATDRATVARGLLMSDGRERWEEWLIDDVKAPRTGPVPHTECFQTGHGSGDATLATFLRDSPPDQSDFGADFNMRDVLGAAWLSEDVSFFYEANLFAMLSRYLTYCRNVTPINLDLARRREFGAKLSSIYTHRNLGCLQCHHSLWATTDSDDPALDRHWPIVGRFEEGLYGAANGRDAGELYAALRILGVLPRSGVLNSEEAETAWPDDPADPVAPWGMDPSCGMYFAPGDVLPDESGTEAFFGGPLGDNASIWSLADRFRQGITALRHGGVPQLGVEEPLEGHIAFAYLFATA
ncbi:MAG: hypothetical protein QF464_22800, partial [Myxococcota bacterium]|nr:hypothetical protein [Myxococcota bacterium]